MIRDFERPAITRLLTANLPDSSGFYLLTFKGKLTHPGKGARVNLTFYPKRNQEPAWFLK